MGFDPGSDGAADRSDALEIPTVPFGTAQPIAGVNSANADDDPTLTEDMLYMVFDSERDSAAGDLFSTTRATVTSPWSPPQIISELQSGSDEDGPCLSPDGLTLTFSSDGLGSIGRGDLFVSTRTTRTSQWSPPTHIPELATPDDEKRLCVSADGLYGVFYSNRDGDDDLFETRRADPGDPWGAAVPVSVSSSVADADPGLHPDGLVVVFDSNRGGNFDLYLAARNSRSDNFGTANVLGGVSSAMIETDPWISFDLRTIVFARGGSNGRDIYTATR